jgi:hypothetical protein
MQLIALCALGADSGNSAFDDSISAAVVEQLDNLISTDDFELLLSRSGGLVID